MNSKSRSLQWLIINFDSNTINFVLIKADTLTVCLQLFCNVISIGGCWKASNEISYQYFRTTSIKASIIDIHEIQRCQSNMKLYVSKSSQGNLELSFAKWDHNHCRVPPKQVECSRGFGISNHWYSLQWMLTRQISKSLPNNAFSRVICFTSSLLHQTLIYDAQKLGSKSQSIYFNKIG